MKQVHQNLLHPLYLELVELIGQGSALTLYQHFKGMTINYPMSLYDSKKLAPILRKENSKEQQLSNWQVETPYWRTLKANGELNAKYPLGVVEQKKLLEAEGHTIIKKGRTNIRYYVKDYEDALYNL